MRVSSKVAIMRETELLCIPVRLAISLTPRSGSLAEKHCSTPTASRTVFIPLFVMALASMNSVSGKLPLTHPEILVPIGATKLL